MMLSCFTYIRLHARSFCAQQIIMDCYVSIAINSMSLVTTDIKTPRVRASVKRQFAVDYRETEDTIVSHHLNLMCS